MQNLQHHDQQVDFFHNISTLADHSKGSGEHGDYSEIDEAGVARANSPEAIALQKAVKKINARNERGADN